METPLHINHFQRRQVLWRGRALLGWFLFLVSFLPLHAEPELRKYAVGINYPGVGLRYTLNPRWSVEARGQFEDDIAVAGLRTYLHMNPLSGVRPFVGLEADHIWFEGDATEGTGMGGLLFVGGELSLTQRLSFQLDVGPAWVTLQDDGSKEEESGVEFVVNMGLNFHFGSQVTR